eukprot:403340916
MSVDFFKELEAKINSKILFNQDNVENDDIYQNNSVTFDYDSYLPDYVKKSVNNQDTNSSCKKNRSSSTDLDQLQEDSAILQVKKNKKEKAKSDNPLACFDFKKPIELQKSEDDTPLTHSQQRILDAFDREQEWDYSLVRFRQTIIGFLIGIFKENENKPLSFDFIQEYMTPYFRYMRKKDNQRYTSNIFSCIQGTLTSNTKLFFKDCKNNWKMNAQPCQEYEELQLGKGIKKPSANRKKDATQNQISTNFMKSKNDKKRKREVIEKFELINHKISHKLDKPFKSARGLNGVEEAWKKLSKSRQGGFMNAFIILRPMLKRAVKQQEKVQRAISMLIKSNIFSKSAHNQPFNNTILSTVLSSNQPDVPSSTLSLFNNPIDQLQILPLQQPPMNPFQNQDFTQNSQNSPLDGIPLITHQDALKLLSMEVSMVNMNDKVNSIYLRMKEILGSRNLQYQMPEYQEEKAQQDQQDDEQQIQIAEQEQQDNQKEQQSEQQQDLQN